MCSSTEKRRKKGKNASNDSEPQINTTAPKVNSTPREASGGALESSFTQELKPQGGAPLAIREYETYYSFKKVVRNDGVTHGKFKYSVHPLTF